MASVMKDNEDTDAADDMPDGESGKGRKKDEVRALDAAREKSPRTGSYFSIYKKGQGYWTRMGTLIGVTIVGLMLCYTLYAEIPLFFSSPSVEEAKIDDQIRQLQTDLNQPEVTPAQVQEKRQTIDTLQANVAQMRDARTTRGSRWAIGIAVGFGVIYFAIALRLMNKPANVDFLIATDSEMKKVNWTSRKDLFGSSRVVILFMFFIAAYLFLNDIVYGWIMYLIDVLKFPPPPFK